MSKSREDQLTPRLSPELQAIVLADDVYTDAATKKKVIAGTFNALWSQKFPAKFGRTTKAYLVLANCHGTQRLKVRYVDLQDESVLMESSEVSVTSKSPLERIEVVMEVPPFLMPHEGQYAFEVYCNGVRVGGIRISVGKQDISKG